MTSEGRSVDERSSEDRAAVPQSRPHMPQGYGLLDPAAEGSVTYRLRAQQAMAWREADFPGSAARWQFAPMP